MKVTLLAFLSFFCVLMPSTVVATLDATQSGEERIHLVNSEMRLQNADAAPLEEPPTPLIKDKLDLPLMRDQLTSTESSQNHSIIQKDTDSDYVQGMQDLAQTLNPYDARIQRQSRTATVNLGLITLIEFIIELTIPFIVLKVAFQFSDYRFQPQQILTICLIVAAVGAILFGTLQLGVFNPARIGISFMIMLVLLRVITQVHDLSTALQMTLIARLISLGIGWLVLYGMSLLLGL